MLEKFEATITFLENIKDMSKITLAELLNALLAQEQRRAMRREDDVEGALSIKHQENARNNKKKKGKKHQGSNEEFTANNNRSKVGNRKSHPPCQHCGRRSHPHFKRWRRLDAKCTKCNQMGHEAIICKNKFQQHGEDAQIADHEEEDKLFVATCFSGIGSSESWLIDSGCTNHMTYDKDLFRELGSTNTSKVRIGNGEYITVEGKGTIVISSCSGTKFISDVLYVPDIDQNLLNVGQLIEKGYKFVFEDKSCLIKDAVGQDIFKIVMKGKSFALNPLKEEQTAFPIKENITEVWHKRLGHYHYQGMLQMKSKMMENALPELDDHIPNCKACQFGKQSRKPFPKVTWRASKKATIDSYRHCRPTKNAFSER